MANDEEPVEKDFMASSSVAVTSKDSANSNLATHMTPAESLPDEVREPLSGGASTPLSGRAPTLSGVRASPKTARPSPTPVPATARTRAAILNNRIHRPSVVTRRAAAELTSAVTRYKGVRPNKNNNDDDDNINNNNHAALTERCQPSTLPKLRQLGIYTITDTPDDNDIKNNNHAALAERFQPSTLHKLRQLGFYAKKVTPDDNNIYNNNHAALTERFQPSTLHKLQQLGLSTNTDTPDDNNIYNNSHAALAECFQPSTLHKLRQPGRYINTVTSDDNINNNNNRAALAERFQPSTLHKLRQLGSYTNADTPDTAHQLDAEAVPAEVAYTRTNTQPSCSGGEESDRVPNIFKEGMAGLLHHTSRMWPTLRSFSKWNYRG